MNWKWVADAALKDVWIRKAILSLRTADVNAHSKVVKQERWRNKNGDERI